MIADEPLQDDGFALPFNQVPPSITCQTITMWAPGAGGFGTVGQGGQTGFKAFGAPNNDTVDVFGSLTTGQSYGLLIQAGSTSTDSPISISNIHGTSLLSMTGLGATVIAGPISSKGAIPAVTAGQTDLGITTTATVITTAGGIALPALASTFWQVNVNGVAYGIPCFAL